MAFALKLEQVYKSYSLAEGAAPVTVLRDVSLEITPGESVAIIGPSGSGKSTLLNLMGTLDRPDKGRVLLAGQDLAALDERALAQVRNQRLGFVFQAHHLLPHCTVWENVLLPTLAPGGKAGQDKAARARLLLKRVGLGDRLEHRPGQLSGGERQRAAVVRALINQPGLLLADEPTGSLDRAAAAELGSLLVELNREEKVTLIVVTHALEIAKLLGRKLELRDGQLANINL